MKTLVDDGVVVYLNGREVRRYNMPGGQVGNQTLAASAIGAPEESTFMNASLSSAGLVNGTNVLAVEIHQGDPVTSDISFDLGLVATPIR